MRKLFRSALIASVACLCSISAYAVPVNIDTGNYLGNWKLNGSTNTGSHSLDLVPGSYNIQITKSDSVDFNVADDGTVTSLKPAAATGIANSLLLKTATINIDPVNYGGRYKFPVTYNPWFSGPQAIEFVTGLDYRMNIGYYGQTNFRVNEDGTVTTLSPDSLESIGSTVTLKNTTIQIDPVDFGGSYHIWGATNLMRNINTATLVPGVTYAMELGLNGVGFDLDATGNVVSVNKPGAIDVIGNKITFKTATISIDTAGYEGAYYIRRGTGTLTGRQDVVLVRGITTRIIIGALNYIGIVIDSSGNVASTNRDDVIEINGSSVIFKNIDIEIASSGANFGFDPYFSGDLTITDGETVSVSLPSNTKHYIRVRQINGFTSNVPNIIEVKNPCAVLPGSHDISNSYGDGTLTYSCPSLVVDTDEDSIPDESDNCPLVANSSQLDLDEDTIGDACDSDIDGDNVDNTTDNCPVIANVDQLDLDTDGLGDECDSDVDGDGVQDAVDNCPFIANVGQGNSDNDQQGDACDTDDDNDTVLDIVDNCPVTPNKNQSDIDADGEGDICDGDRDGDSVENAADLCPATPTGTIVNINGCNGSQFIAMSCVSSDFKNHGQYVSCVTSAAKEAVNLALISKKDKSKFVTEAAKLK